MSLSLFFKSVVVYLSLALIVYAVSSDAGLDVLLKLLAFAAAASLLTPIGYPYLRGVRKGDEVSVEMGGRTAMPGIFKMFFQTGAGTAMENGRTGGRIMVLMADGAIRQCVITGYAGFFKPAQGKLAGKEEVSPSLISVV